MVFRYPTRRGARSERENPIIGKPPAQPQEILGLIQGKTPQSFEEYRVGLALIRYNVDFIYQVPIRGGRMLRGGQLLDFLLFIPNPLPLQVFGNYWHRAQLRDRDRLKLNVLQQEYGVEPVVIWGDEVQTQDDANRKVREVIGL